MPSGRRPPDRFGRPNASREMTEARTLRCELIFRRRLAVAVFRGVFVLQGVHDVEKATEHQDQEGTVGKVLQHRMSYPRSRPPPNASSACACGAGGTLRIPSA